MKLTKSKLKQIIKEEMVQIFEDYGDNPKGPRGWTVSWDAPSAGVSLEALWRDLNILLKNWTDREHPYYTDLYNLLEDYSTSPDRPTRLPNEEEAL